MENTGTTSAASSKISDEEHLAQVSQAAERRRRSTSPKLANNQPEKEIGLPREFGSVGKLPGSGTTESLDPPSLNPSINPTKLIRKKTQVSKEQNTLEQWLWTLLPLGIGALLGSLFIFGGWFLYGKLFPAVSIVLN